MTGTRRQAQSRNKQQETTFFTKQKDMENILNGGSLFEADSCWYLCAIVLGFLYLLFLNFLSVFLDNFSLFVVAVNFHLCLLFNLFSPRMRIRIRMEDADLVPEKKNTSQA